MSNDDDADFGMNSSDEEPIQNTISSCKTCGISYSPSTGPVDFLYEDLCEPCSAKFKEGLKKLDAFLDSNPSNVETSRNTNSDGMDGDDNGSDTGNVGGPSDRVDSSADKVGSDNNVESGGEFNLGDKSALGEKGDDSVVIENSITPTTSKNTDNIGGDADMTFDVMLTAVFSCGAKSGLVSIHGHDYKFSACPKVVYGRGGGTTLINTEHSKSIPELFGYYYYAGLFTRSYSCMAFTMTECGNLFMGVMETMCNKCRIDPVIYFTETNTCRIIGCEPGGIDRQWRKTYKLNCILNLSIDIDKAKR
jgi:hypothetical protein